MALIYLATNLVNGKRYVGVTRTSLAQRLYKHVWNATSSARSAKHSLFGKAIRKYGKNAFRFAVLRDALSYDEALQQERQLITDLTPEYNLAAGGQGPQGTKWTADRHVHMKMALSLAWTDERKRAQSARFKGKTISASARKKMRAARLRAKSGFRSVVCLDDGRWFESIRAASRAYGCHDTQILRSCSGEEISAKGKCFAYAPTPLSSAECSMSLAERKARRNDRRRRLRPEAPRRRRGSLPPE